MYERIFDGYQDELVAPIIEVPQPYNFKPARFGKSGLVAFNIYTHHTPRLDCQTVPQFEATRNGAIGLYNYAQEVFRVYNVVWNKYMELPVKLN